MMEKEQVKQLALANGFKLKQQPDGTEDLNPYVYEFALALMAQAGLAGYFRGTDDAWKDLTGGSSPEQMTAHRAIEYSNQVRQGGE